MEIKLCCNTVEEYAEKAGLTAEDVLEMYADGIVMLFFAQKGDDDGSLVGVQYEDGDCSVYGCRQDEEFITFGHMLEVLVEEFLFG